MLLLLLPCLTQHGCLLLLLLLLLLLGRHQQQLYLLPWRRCLAVAAGGTAVRQ
jgi:hypothetical protein